MQDERDQQVEGLGLVFLTATAIIAGLILVVIADTLAGIYILLK